MQKLTARERLGQYMAAANLNQAQAASKIGCHQGTLSKLLAGAIKSPDISLLVGVEKFTKGKIKCQDWVK